MKLLPSADFISVNHFADSTWRPMPNRIWLLANRSRADNVLMQANVSSSNLSMSTSPANPHAASTPCTVWMVSPQRFNKA